MIRTSSVRCDSLVCRHFFVASPHLGDSSRRPGHRETRPRGSFARSRPRADQWGPGVSPNVAMRGKKKSKVHRKKSQIITSWWTLRDERLTVDIKPGKFKLSIWWIWWTCRDLFPERAQKKVSKKATSHSFNQIHPRIWVNYHFSLSWNLRPCEIWGWFPSCSHHSRLRSRHEVVRIYPEQSCQSHANPCLTLHPVLWVGFVVVILTS